MRYVQQIILVIVWGWFAGVVSYAQGALPLYDLPDALTYAASSSNSVVVLSGGRVAVANMLADSVALVDVRTNVLLVEIPVGDDPRGVAVTPDGSRLLVTNRGDNSLFVIDIAAQVVIATHYVGQQPYAVLTDDNQTAYVSLQGDATVIEIDIQTGEIISTITTPEQPTGLSIWGDFLYVTHFYSGQVSMVYLPTGEVVRTITTGVDVGMMPSIFVDHRNGIAYVPQTIAYPNSTEYDRMLRPRVIVIDLAQMRVLHEDTIWLDIADQPVNMPFSVALNVAQGRLFVLNAGSNDLSVIDLKTGLAIEHTDVLGNPRGIVSAQDGTFLYVQQAIDTTLSIIETRFYHVRDTIPTATQMPPLAEQIGASLFHRADDVRVSATPYLSCAGCHFDGESDGRVWLGVQTPALSQISDNFDINVHIQLLTDGVGFDDVASFEQQALLDYVLSLHQSD
jgi:YVTN family beta-propeller protein